MKQVENRASGIESKVEQSDISIKENEKILRKHE
jgi:hypothetical protein